MSPPRHRGQAAALELHPPDAPGSSDGAPVRILRVELLPADRSRIAGAAIDRPSAGDEGTRTTLSLAGWALGVDVPAVAIDILHEGRVIRKIPLAFLRGDVAARFEGTPVRERCGFRTSLSVLGLPARFDLLLRVVFDDGEVRPLATIEADHASLPPGYAPRLLPLGVTTLGRTGSTWLMRLLREHPQVVVHGGYPYETRSAAYWLHMVRVLSEPANALQSSHPDAFPDSLWSIGHHPFNHESLSDQPALRDWFANDYPRALATLAQQSIDAFYGRAAEAEAKPSAAWFAEKLTPGHVPRLMWEMYPRGGEIILVRDFRDMACSILAFNAKRGFVAFGRENVATDAEFVERNLRIGAQRLLEGWRERADRACLIRYEDLVLDPRGPLATACERFGLDADPEILDRVVERASRREGDLDRHRTSRDPSASIGRWREELAPDLARVCRVAFQDALEAFGYELD